MMTDSYDSKKLSGWMRHIDICNSWVTIIYEDWWLVTIDDNRGFDDGHMYRQLKKCGNFEKCISA